MVRRAGFTLIEMIFTIVIIGIIVAGVPRMISQNQDAFEDNFISEAIFLASAQASQTLSSQWDQNSMLTVAGADDYAKQLDLPGQVRANPTLRVGNIAQPGHRKLHSVVTTPLNGNLAVPPLPAQATGTTDYKDTYAQQVVTGFIPISATGNFVLGDEAALTAAPTHMKMAAITIRATNTALTTTLRVYAANIGEHDYARRDF